jgi:hypothetical protein
MTKFVNLAKKEKNLRSYLSKEKKLGRKKEENKLGRMNNRNQKVSKEYSNRQLEEGS